MALQSIPEAKAQLNANLDWDSRPAAIPFALEAVRFLIFNRPALSSAGDSKMEFERLTTMESRLSTLAQNTPRLNPTTEQRCSFTQARARR